MKKNNLINPVGLKGNEINERMKELMGISNINENKSNIVVELTKMGPDGKAYAIIRENHDYYIKSTDKTSNLVAEDFKYIGGLQNKKQEAYSSYAKAIKHLNLKFNSLSEAFNSDININTFIDDNLLSEGGVGGYYEQTNSGFSGAGNLDGNTELYEEEMVDETEEEVELTEEEQAVEDMMKEAEETAEDEEIDGDKGEINEHRLSISRAINKMDSIIDGLTEGKKKVYTLK